MSYIPRPKTSHLSFKMTVVDVPNHSIPEEELISIYRWLDELRFSRTKKKSPHRDFADGVMMAELVWQYLPKIVDLVNYQPASSSARKRENWKLLNSRVFKKIWFQLTPKLLAKVADGEPRMIEQVLCKLRSILILGKLALLPPSERLHQVKSRFTSVRRIFKEHDDPKNQNSERILPESPLFRSRSRSRSRPNTAPTPTRGRSPSIKRQNCGIGTRPLSARPSVTPRQSTLVRPSSSSRQSRLVRPSESTPRQRSSRSSSRTNPADRVIDEFDIVHLYPQSRTESIDDFVVKKAPKSPSCLSESEEEGDTYQESPSKMDDYNANEEEEVYDEIYCDSAPKESISNDVKQCDSEGKVKQKVKRVVRTYEHREEYVLNGMTVGSTTYSLPQNEEEMKSLTDSRSRRIKSK